MSENPASSFQFQTKTEKIPPSWTSWPSLAVPATHFPFPKTKTQSAWKHPNWPDSKSSSKSDLAIKTCWILFYPKLTLKCAQFTQLSTPFFFSSPWHQPIITNKFNLLSQGRMRLFKILIKKFFMNFFFFLIFLLSPRWFVCWAVFRCNWAGQELIVF